MLQERPNSFFWRKKKGLHTHRSSPFHIINQILFNVDLMAQALWQPNAGSLVWFVRNYR